MGRAKDLSAPLYLSPVLSVYAHDITFVAMSGRVNRLNVSCTEVYRLAIYRMEEFMSRQCFYLLHSGHQIRFQTADQ